MRDPDRRHSFGIHSERRLFEDVHLNLAYRWFCPLGPEGDISHYSTCSKGAPFAPGPRSARHALIKRTEDRFVLWPERAAAHSAYGSAAVLGWVVHERRIEPHPRVRQIVAPRRHLHVRRIRLLKSGHSSDRNAIAVLPR
jgi:hypothetical protein